MGIVRFLLAFSVLLSHLPPATFHFISGALGVQAFYIVSGFYMALILDEKYADTRLFYSNRLLRLAPAYFAVMLIGIVVLIAFNMTVTSSAGIFEAALSNPLTAVVMLFENIFVIGQHLLYWFSLEGDGSLVFDPEGGLPTETTAVAWQALIVPQSWSLSIELMFYAVAPWLARKQLWVIAVIAAASIGLRIAGYWIPVEFGLWQGRLFSTALFMFLFGMIAYRALPLVEDLPKWLHGAVLAAMVVLIVFLPQTGAGYQVQAWSVYIGIAAGAPFAFALTRNISWDRWIGEMSYPIYLTHLIVVAGVLIYEVPYPVWSVIGITLTVSALLMVFVERPVDKWRQARVRRRQIEREEAAAIVA
ncbi:acyltransferase family protein [Aurantiacibacter sp. D1-12]|uniref:acyltransferase family protein n=1 Tax=Aurantiacibacter sp. D1-12 TaxID=2993658 RepID=UPI00237C9F94|nr:acyltransferase [Aurantiacibacter sp. D1-12]MDE1466863.1 acyltransferase [Aurantiacibacter sp. D1-12]